MVVAVIQQHKQIWQFVEFLSIVNCAGKPIIKLIKSDIVLSYLFGGRRKGKFAPLEMNVVLAILGREAEAIEYVAHEAPLE